MQTIVFHEKPVKRSRRIRKRIFWIIPIAILAAAGFLYATNFNAVNNILSFHTFKVNYGTYSVQFSSDFSSTIKDEIGKDLDTVKLNDRNRFKVVDSDADITISTQKSDSDVDILDEYLIPVGHRYSLKDSTSVDDIKTMNVYVLNDTYTQFLKDQYGITAQKVDGLDSLISTLEKSDNNVGLVTFADLSYQLKILYVGGKYYLDDDTAGIPVAVYASVKNSDDLFILDTIKNSISGLETKLDQSKILKLNMTGVTAIARDLGSKMNKLNDYVYPAKDIGTFLADADLTHTSNEVSFDDSCVPVASMRFCANPKSIQALQYSGIDIIELTGNHNNDYGFDDNTDTINTYANLGWRYFGGGLNATDASKILYEDVDGTKVAFLGYNYYDTMLNDAEIAGDDTPGSNSYSVTKLASDIQTAKANADIVIVDIQFQECYCYPDGDVIFPLCYMPLTSPDQKGVFRKAIDLGANIVIGTQAHQPQTYELYGDGAIFYGLGNLFFDQYEWIGTRQGMVLTHYFYDGKYIQTKITATMIGLDLKNEIATQAQSDQLMKLLKTARENME